jgi:hypothetical protein
MKCTCYWVRFQVFKAASMKMTVFWAAAPRSLVEAYRRFRGICCLYHQGYHRHNHDGGSKHLWTSVNFYQTTRRNTPEDSHLRTCYCSHLACGPELILSSLIVRLTVNIGYHRHRCTQVSRFCDWQIRVYIMFPAAAGWARLCYET